MLKKDKRVIYFIQSATPTEQELALAASVGKNVVFRNVQFANESCPEDCDAVAGAVIPAIYKEKYPDVTPAAAIPPAPPAPPAISAADGWGAPAIPPAPPVES